MRGGYEAVVHTTRATLSGDTILLHSCWSLHVDFENGFNQGDRSRIVEEVQAHFPQLSRWVETCYREHSCLNFRVRVKQEDPLGPLLFVLLLQPVAQRLQAVKGLHLNAWYLHNGTPWSGLGRPYRKPGTS